MENQELAKRIHEITGRCWHKPKNKRIDSVCVCGARGWDLDKDDSHYDAINFDPTSPADFFWLLGWCKEQEESWFNFKDFLWKQVKSEAPDFLAKIIDNQVGIPVEHINPLPFATAVAEFKWKEGG